MSLIIPNSANVGLKIIGDPASAIKVVQSSLDKGLIAHYPLNGKYLAKDVTPNCNHGVVTGATLTTDRMGIANSAYLFNGINDHISFPTNVGNFGTNTTMRFVFKMLRLENDNLIATKTNGVAVDGWWINTYGNGAFSLFVNGGGDMARIDAIKSMSLNKFYDVAITKSNGDYNIYFDGILNSSKTMLIPNTSNSIFYIGSGNLANYSNCIIEEWCIYNRSLSQAEITQLYNYYE